MGLKWVLKHGSEMGLYSLSSWTKVANYLWSKLSLATWRIELLWKATQMTRHRNMKTVQQLWRTLICLSTQYTPHYFLTFKTGPDFIFQTQASPDYQYLNTALYPITQASPDYQYLKIASYPVTQASSDYQYLKIASYPITQTSSDYQYLKTALYSNTKAFWCTVSFSLSVHPSLSSMYISRSCSLLLLWI